MKIFLSLFLFLFPIASFSALNEVTKSPGINDHYYEEPDYAHWGELFERPGREVYDMRGQIIRAMDIQPGMSVADIGAGSGLFTRAFSDETGPAGTVYAVDIIENFIQGILSDANAAGAKNIVGVVNTAKDVNLPAGSIDIAFICNTYHHFEYPLSMLASIRKALRPGGSLIIIDFRKIKGFSSGWVMSHTRADKKMVIDEVSSAGFNLAEDRDLLRANFYLRFNR